MKIIVKIILLRESLRRNVVKITMTRSLNDSRYLTKEEKKALNPMAIIAIDPVMRNILTWVGRKPEDHLKYGKSVRDRTQSKVERLKYR